MLWDLAECCKGRSRCTESVRCSRGCTGKGRRGKMTLRNEEIQSYRSLVRGEEARLRARMKSQVDLRMNREGSLWLGLEKGKLTLT